MLSNKYKHQILVIFRCVYAYIFLDAYTSIFWNSLSLNSHFQFSTVSLYSTNGSNWVWQGDEVKSQITNNLFWSIKLKSDIKQKPFLINQAHQTFRFNVFTMGRQDVIEKSLKKGIFLDTKVYPSSYPCQVGQWVSELKV